MVKHTLENGFQVVIKEATADDSSEIERIVNSVASEKIYIVPEESRKDWDKAIEDIKKRNSLIIVAAVDKKVVGMAHLVKGKFEKTRHVGELGIVIEKDFRGKGIGTAMMQYLMEWAEKQKYLEKISLTVFSTNQPAIKLYKNFGFKAEGICRKQYKIEGSYVDDVIMARLD